MPRKNPNSEATIGHNSYAGSKEQLQSIIDRVEKLEEEKAATASDIRDIYSEAKGNGLDARAIRTIIKMRKQDAGEREEQEAILSLYLSALGMLSDTPLGEAAVKRTFENPLAGG